MTLPEIDPDPPRQLGTDFARRGPWGAHFARSGNNNKTTKGTDGDLTRRWAHGPANYLNALRAYTATVPMAQYDVPEVSRRFRPHLPLHFAIKIREK